MEVTQRIEANETAVLAHERAIEMEVRRLCQSERELTALFYDKPILRSAYVRLTGPQEFGRSHSSMAHFALAAGLPVSGRPAAVRRKLLHRTATAGDLFELAYIGRVLTVRLGQCQKRNSDLEMVLCAIPPDSQPAVNMGFARKFEGLLFNQPRGARLNGLQSTMIRDSLATDFRWLEQQIKPLVGDYPWPGWLRNPTFSTNSRLKRNADGTVELSNAEVASLREYLERRKLKTKNSATDGKDEARQRGDDEDGALKDLLEMKKAAAEGRKVELPRAGDR
jgi:hypothetical protein